MTQLSLDGLKVDKSFVDRIPTQKETTHIVSKIVEMARGLDIDVIAEGVETAEQLDTLKQMGCTHIQGYFVSKPLPRLELEELLDSLKVESRRSAVR